jgi:hypothetical protein
MSVLNMLHTLRFSLQNVIYFIMLPLLVSVLFTFYKQDALKFKCKIKVLSVLNMLHTLRFYLQNAIYFIMLPFFGFCIIHILHTGCAKI